MPLCGRLGFSFRYGGFANAAAALITAARLCERLLTKREINQILILYMCLEVCVCPFSSLIVGWYVLFRFLLLLSAYRSYCRLIFPTVCLFVSLSARCFPVGLLVLLSAYLFYCRLICLTVCFSVLLFADLCVLCVWVCCFPHCSFAAVVVVVVVLVVVVVVVFFFCPPPLSNQQAKCRYFVVIFFFVAFVLSREQRASPTARAATFTITEPALPRADGLWVQ